MPGRACPWVRAPAAGSLLCAHVAAATCCTGSACEFLQPAGARLLAASAEPRLMSTESQGSKCPLRPCCRGKRVSRPSELGRVRRAWGERAPHPGWAHIRSRWTSVTVATQTADEVSLRLPEEHGVAVREPEVTGRARPLRLHSCALRFPQVICQEHEGLRQPLMHLPAA